MDLEFGMSPQPLLSTASSPTTPLISKLDHTSYIVVSLGGLQWGSVLFKLWSSIVFVAQVVFIITGILLLFLDKLVPLLTLLSVCIISQGVGAIVCSYHNSLRLRRPPDDGDVAAINFWSPYAAALSALLVVSGLILGGVLVALDPNWNGDNVISHRSILITAVVAFVLINIVLCGNLIFVVADAEVISRKIESLKKALHEKPSTINITLIVAARCQINHRISQGMVPSTALLSTAVMNVVIVLASMVISKHALSTVALFLLCYREVILAFVAFWNIALVNEKYDELILDLEQYISATFDPTCSACPDSERCWLMTSLQSSPITFPIMGLTLRRKGVIFQFSLWIFGILLSAATKHF
jgi:hypothetical protein